MHSFLLAKVTRHATHSSFFTDSEPSVHSEQRRRPSQMSLPTPSLYDSIEGELQPPESPAPQRDEEWLQQQLEKQHWQVLRLLQQSDVEVAKHLGETRSSMERLCEGAPSEDFTQFLRT